MNKLFTLIMVLLAASCASGPGTHVDELRLTADGNRVYGEFYHPEGKSPLVVISHGFSPEATAKTVESIVENIRSTAPSKINKYMIDEKILSELRGRDVVIFVATEGEIDESASPFPVVITGYGKMRMYAALARWYESLEAGRHPIVLNIGSAGSAKYPIGEVVSVGSYINGGDDFVFDRIESSHEGASVYSGDFFMSTKTFSPEEVKRLSTAYDLFDMEAYAVAYFCSSYGVPYYCFKAVSDNLDGTVKDWESILGEIKATFSQLLERLI